MKGRFNNSRSESGIALVITLVMLAIVTLMAIVFLAMSRRERASVQMVQDLATAEYMADVALERAKAQAVAQMAVAGSKLSYDLFVSTNFMSPFGFAPQGGNRDPNPTNVNYVYNNGTLVTGDDRLQVIRNLQYDARVPIYITTNENENAPMDFRFFIDFDRNRFFNTNGMLVEIDHRGLAIEDANGNLITNRFVGDPEWIGVLQNPNEPHGELNRFVGRVAYVALPAGKTLSLNHIHNHADLRVNAGTARSANGFIRNQGYGSWELNLAAFLRELNTNTYAWDSNSYAMGLAPVGNGQYNLIGRNGAAFNNAREFLNFRYDGSRNNLLPASSLFNNANFEFASDGIDNYSDGPFLMNGSLGFAQDDDDADNPWPGSPTTNALYDVQDLFKMASYQGNTGDFTNRLMQAMEIRPGKRSTYDQYTFYRLLSQMGVDATPYLKGKLHLNYSNQVGQVGPQMLPWTDATEFFTKAADLMLKTSIVKNIIPLNHLGQHAKRGERVVGLHTNYVIGDTTVRPDISINNIQIWTNSLSHAFLPGNEYSTSVRRILQVAANIWDNMTNRWSMEEGTRGGPRLPTVFRPIFKKTGTNVVISGFEEVVNAVDLRSSTNWTTWIDLDTFARDATYPVDRNYNRLMMHGQPWIIGAKMGHPNFNEFSVESDVLLTRRIELSRPNASAPVNDTNVLHTLSLRNIWGVEGWNSYIADYNRPIEIFADVSSTIVLSNRFGMSTSRVHWATNYAMAIESANTWRGMPRETGQYTPGNFKIPLHSQQVLFSQVDWLSTPPFYFRTNTPQTANLFLELHEQPNLHLYTTNKVRFWMVDTGIPGGRVVDFVTMDNLTTYADLSLWKTNSTSGATAQTQTPGAVPPGMMWDPTPVAPGSLLTIGITNQIAVASGDPAVYSDTWKAYTTMTGDKRASIDAFRTFIGLHLLFDWKNPPRVSRNNYETPFNPTWRLYARNSWGANDPLVHYTPTDLLPVQQREYPALIDPIPANAAGYSGNLGFLNDRYEPWGLGQNHPIMGDDRYDMTLKDPGVRGSDNWDFPIDRGATNYFRYPNIGWLGQVHRGTPWQTIYLKSTPPRTNHATMWLNKRGTLGTHPLRDYRLLDVFTVAPNEAAASGLLSINQTNKAAWSAVLSGLPQTIITNPTEITLTTQPGYGLKLIEPASAQLATIVDSINQYRATSTLKTNWFNRNGVWTAQVYTNGVFESVGHVLGAPGLSRSSPFLLQDPTGAFLPARRVTNHVAEAWTDRIVEQIPMQIMSLLQRDEPRFVVYAFGQALQPAPRSIETSANYYGLCTNYQITGEVITKTVFRVDGELNDSANPLRAVVESYKVLPPPE